MDENGYKERKIEWIEERKIIDRRKGR